MHSCIHSFIPLFQTLTIWKYLGKVMADRCFQSVWAIKPPRGKALVTGSWQDFAVQPVALWYCYGNAGMNESINQQVFLVQES